MIETHKDLTHKRDGICYKYTH